MIKYKPSDFVEKFIYVEGQPFKGESGFDYWPFLRDIYDDNSKYMILKASRQCSKSTTVGNKLLTYSSLIPGFKALFVAPTQDQCRTFSNDRLMTPIEQSPLIKKLTSRKMTNNVTEKRFINNSVIRLRSAFVDPGKSRARGISARMVTIDEIQNMEVDHIPPILECAATFPTNRIILFAGTPLTFDNAIEYYWSKMSSMNEWMVKCGSCGNWNGIKINNIGVEGYVCSKCTTILDIRGGEWISYRKNAQYSGYHINQLMTPYTWKAWEDSIINKYKAYGLPQFMNEVLGESYDSGVKPVSREQVLKCCRPYNIIHIPSPELSRGLTVAGIDWGTGDKSYTVMMILNWNVNQHYKVLYAKRYRGLEAIQDTMLAEMKRVLHSYNVNKIGADWGYGVYGNFELTKEFGRGKVVPIFYSDSSKAVMKWDKAAHRITANKPSVLEVIFQLIKRQEVVFPKEEEWMEPFGDDILNEFIEENHRSNKLRYSHPVSTTDDALHALVYAVLAAQFIQPRTDLFSPESLGEDRLS